MNTFHNFELVPHSNLIVSDKYPLVFKTGSWVITCYNYSCNKLFVEPKSIKNLVQKPPTYGIKDLLHPDWPHPGLQFMLSDMTQYIQQTSNVIMSLSLQDEPYLVSVDKLGKDPFDSPGKNWHVQLVISVTNLSCSKWPTVQFVFSLLGDNRDSSLSPCWWDFPIFFFF